MIKNLFFLCVVTFYISLPYAGYGQGLTSGGMGGDATVFESINNEDNGRLLPGFGAGFRYTVIQDTHMNVGMDIAAGRNLSRPYTNRN